MVVLLWHVLVNFHIYSSPFYLATTQSQCLLVIGKDYGLNTFYHSWELACQQRLLKTFSGHGSLGSEDGIIWLWLVLANLHIHSSQFYLALAQSWLGRMIVWTIYGIVSLSAEAAKNVNWPWLSPLRGRGSLTMACIDKFAHISLSIVSCYCSVAMFFGHSGAFACQ